MQYIAVLGSTGSIGTSTLKVVRNLRDKFRILALSTNSNIDILYRQVKEFDPEFISVQDLNAGVALEKKIGKQVLCGEESLEKIIRDKRIKKIVLAISGSAALKPLLKAIEARKQIALANKEALVMAGPLIMRRARDNGVKIIPVDSEQSAIWQCLEGEDRKKIKKIYLTASGGPFRKYSKQQMKKVSISACLKHPRWKMGKKISVDSANLMNKGLELLEAMYLFNLKPDNIEVLIHPEAIIHSMVEFVDGVVMAQLSFTDMRIPIQYALTYPERLPNNTERLNFAQVRSLNFEKPDFNKFPCLGLAFLAARQGGTMPCVLNAANEVCVEEFLKGGLKFFSIPMVIEKILRKHKNVVCAGLGDILAADLWARSQTARIIKTTNDKRAN